LFINVDEQNNSHIVSFVFHQDRIEEAMMVIPALPIVLQAKYGARVWDWFNEEAKLQAEDYFWDTKKGLQSKEDEALALQLEEWDGGWEIEEEEDEGEEPSRMVFEQFKIVTDQPGKNQFYDDSKSVASFATEKVQDKPAKPAASTGDSTWQMDFDKKMESNGNFWKYITSKYLNPEAAGISNPSEEDKAAAEESGEGK
jgi:hypothetical protein